ncbi:MAG: tRNA epoxyqueuosine(34) reductase QueG [Bacteroidetes bacterium B1(2017)]|nr:MAG: tRNA epoxyqueuosine(34) reductase QueG [Bacteroidetes bacterium B1(2017)]
MNLSEKNSILIKAEAKRLGFAFCGVSKADFLEEEAPRLEQWLKENRNGKMGYMENHFDKRLDPRLLVDGAKSVISMLYNYHNPSPVFGSNQLKVSQYAYGEDYHEVVKDKLKELLFFIQTEIGDVNGRAFVDSAPVLEKAWAQKSGLGWLGKNGNIIHKGAGSYFFLSELILDLELAADTPVTDHCGTCTACIDACPTEAIYEPNKVDGSKCISYFTIELKDAIPEELKGKWANWIFGCDICMDVCPWNKFAKATKEPRFEPNKGFELMNSSNWQDISEELFTELFKKSPLKRSKYNGLKRNIDFLIN